MTYALHEGHYVFWREKLVVPTKKRKKSDGNVIYLVKDVPFEDTNKYWEYVHKDGEWLLYYVLKGVNKRLAYRSSKCEDPKTILMMIKSKEITVNDCKRIEENKRHPGGKVIATVNWSIEYDNQSIIALCLMKPKMSFNDIKNVIEAEGGYVDSEGIIHRGSATTKIVEI